MLILSRKMQQEIALPDYDIVIRVLEIKGSRVKLGIEAPEQVKIMRSEIVCEANGDFLAASDRCASHQPAKRDLPRRPESRLHTG